MLKTIRSSLQLTQAEIALRITDETGHYITRGYVSVIERGKANPPAWLLMWMQQPRSIPVPACLSCGAAHAVADCHGQSGVPAWRQPHGPRGVIREDWLARYRAVFPRPVGINGPP